VRKSGCVERTQRQKVPTKTNQQEKKKRRMCARIYASRYVYECCHRPFLSFLFHTSSVAMQDAFSPNGWLCHQLFRPVALGGSGIKRLTYSVHKCKAPKLALEQKWEKQKSKKKTRAS
jgi:hypothetical protein